MNRARRIRHSVLGHWPSTLAGIALGVSEILEGVSDVTSLTWHELAVRAAKGVAIASLGVFGRFGSSRRDRAELREDPDRE